MQVLKIEDDDNEALEILLELGLTADKLKSYVRAGQSARVMATENHPANAGGTLAYFEVVKTARDDLLSKGWERKCVQNLELTFNPIKNIAIAITGGDKDTGLFGGIPKSRNPKGNQTVKYVSSNQLDLFGESADIIENDNTCETWVLMYYADAKLEEVRFELSLPIDIDHNSRICGWKKRIIFKPIKIDSLETTNTFSQEFAPDPVLEISKRQLE